MTNQPNRYRRNLRETLRGRIAAVLFVLWLVATAAIWTELVHAPVGALATADAGHLVTIRGSSVTTTKGYFHVSTDPSALVGTPLQVVRTNSLWSETGLQLCATRSADKDYWCSDITDGYAGTLSATTFARQAWSHETMSIVLILALVLTVFGWSPAAAVRFIGNIWSGDETN